MQLLGILSEVMLTAGVYVGCMCKNLALTSNLGVSPRRD